MKITVLASGSNGNAYFISDNKTNLLIDCGIPYNLILAKSNFASIDACLVSHCHKDHSLSVKELLKHGISVYANTETIEKSKSVHYNLNNFINIGTPSFNIGTFRIHHFEVKHDVQNTGFMIQSMESGETLVYITDTSYSPFVFNNINYFILECNYIKSILDQNTNDDEVSVELRNRIVKNHMSLETVMKLIEKSGVNFIKQLYLTHLSKNNSDENIIKREIQKLSGVEVYVC